MTKMNPAGIPPADRMTLDDGCAILGMTRKQLVALVEDGQMRGGQIGRRWVLYRVDVMDAQAEQERLEQERRERLARREARLTEQAEAERARREERRRTPDPVADAMTSAGFGYGRNGPVTG